MSDDPYERAWVRTGKLSIYDARGMVAELAKWMRGMECVQEEEVAELADQLVSPAMTQHGRPTAFVNTSEYVINLVSQ